MGFNQFSTGFVLGGVIVALVALLYRRCPPTSAAARPTENGLHVVKREAAA